MFALDDEARMAQTRSWGRERRCPRRHGPALHVCVPRWTFRLPFVVNDLEQTLHWKGLSPVCVRTWIWRALALEKGFRHDWQTCRGELFRRGLPERPPPVLRDDEDDFKEEVVFLTGCCSVEEEVEPLFPSPFE